MGLRRLSAGYKRKRCQDVWPISPSAGATPPGWPGWPDGKKFAFVLTHDVEDVVGLEKTRRLAEFEIDQGVRSSFNFIPEGPYQVPAETRHWLTEHGFEVGVHDLQHDGRLFGSRRGFKQKSLRINHHLREWKAAGFRSGFMLRNLGWLHQLDIQYDSSTFDTDPFELQSNGADTIFPFWIPTGASDVHSAHPYSATGNSDTASTRGGYVELPYTLAQDSTLFLVLRESSPEIWKRKLDWVAAHGGMAMVDVHPDYVQFEGDAPSPRTYPVAFYREFLDYVRERYRGEYWPALPRDVAALTANLRSPPSRPLEGLEMIRD